MRGLGLVVLLALGLSCKHEPETKPVTDDQLVVGLTDVFGQSAVLEAVAVEGYQFEYVAASSDTSHLVKVTRVDGSAADLDEVMAKLKGRDHVRFVEKNAVRQPR